MKKIKKYSDPESWAYCPLKQNQADMITRGVSAMHLDSCKVTCGMDPSSWQKRRRLSEMRSMRITLVLWNWNKKNNSKGSGTISGAGYRPHKLRFGYQIAQSNSTSHALYT